MSQRYEKLKTLLKKLFQLDQPDLDFGLYRVMHAKSDEVSQFLDEDLLPQVRAAFDQYKTADKAELEKKLSKVIAGIEAGGMNPDNSPRVQELRTQLQSDAVDIAVLESEVYDHLYGFFRRYYSEGDFLAKRVYKSGVYAIPYEGEEVTLHWANKDQYYIKTSEYLRDYAFRLRPDNEKNPMRVHFRLVDVAEGEHGNVKTAEGKNRVFILATAGDTGHDFIAEENGEQGKELVVRFKYRPATLTDWPENRRAGKKNPPKQKDLITFATERILTVANPALAEWVTELGKTHILASGDKAEYSRLEAHLNCYTARNAFDYFIHKDLGTFLRRELDFYIKNEVMHLDDVENESAPRVEQYLSKIKVIRRVAGKIIDFIAQLEDFQKKLWLKKKFVVETRYCITVGSIPEEFYPEIAVNNAQHEEWVNLFAIHEIKGDLTTPAYSEKLKPEFLKANPTLVVDTRHFDSSFTERLLDAIGEIDELTDGVLFHSENFQALSIMQARYHNQASVIYIDPPYNTSASEIAYKNNYKHSSWACLMANRLSIGKYLLSPTGVQITAIDDTEFVLLNQLIDALLPVHDRTPIVVNHHPAGAGLEGTNVSATHEYAIFSTPLGKKVLLGPETTMESHSEIAFIRTGTATSNLRIGRPNSFYAVLVDPSTNQVHGAEPPPKSDDYPTKDTAGSFRRIYPVGKDGTERVWRRSYESCLKEIENGNLRLRNGKTLYIRSSSTGKHKPVFSNWTDTRYNAGVHGTNVLKAILGGSTFGFSYPKSIHTVCDCISAVIRSISKSQLYSDDGIIVLDYFAGSGTTGHAVIKLNRVDGGRRKFILVEIGDYFDTVLLPRIKKVTFTPEWKDGKPKRLTTSEEAKRSPRIVKIVRLESYEDALNNLETRRTDKQQLLLDAPEAQGADGLKGQYMLRYMLDVETRGSQSLLNVQAFADPTAYKLKVKRPGSDESREVNVDLLETFNWLIGLTVRHIAAPQTFSTEFECDSEGRLRLIDRLKQDDEGLYWFRTVTGTTPDGRRTLVIWRKLTGEPEEDNLVLDEWFTRQGYSAKDSEFDLIYVNGDNNLENLKTPDDLWKVRLIEEDFHRLMFEMEEV